MVTPVNWFVRRALSADSKPGLMLAALRRIPLAGRLLRDRSLDGWFRPHPFDALNGTDTGGYESARSLRSGAASDPYITGYAGCAPGIVRRMLAFVPDASQTSFVDLGCGKGRVLIVAAEFGFARVIGVELSPELARTARRNAEIVAARFPDRVRIEAVEGDAVEYDFPPGPLAIFLYHPFHRMLMRRLADRLAVMCAEGRTIHVLYCNALFADIFDGLPCFEPVFAATIACDPDERGYAPADGEPVAIWTSKPV